MAKVNHNNFIDTINDLLLDARNRGITQVFADDDAPDGRIFYANGKEYINFSTCGYLGLERHPKVIELASEFLHKYGTQTGTSRGYISTKATGDLEYLLGQIYQAPVMLYSSTSAAHIGVLPTIIRNNRQAVIIDQQAHMSIQTAAQLVRVKGVEVDMIRHSNMNILEDKLKEWNGKYDKVWYLCDGVYSMYGDAAPYEELKYLMDKYPALHVYMDDAHGVSWHGPRGAGYSYAHIGGHPKLILVPTIAKSFGAIGGLVVFPNEEMHQAVRLFGGPYTYSHPIPPPTIGAAIASAKIHLSSEIVDLQKELKERIDYCYESLISKNLPVLSSPDTPIFFLACGLPKVGYSMVKRLHEEGFYTSIGLFPAVPMKNTGVRFTVSRHLSLEDIDALTSAMAYHLPLALEENERTVADVRKAFKLPEVAAVTSRLASPYMQEQEPTSTLVAESSTSSLFPNFSITYSNTIDKIDAAEWNGLLAKNGTFDAASLKMLELSFSNNILDTDNWAFHYFVIRDQANKPILATFFTELVMKDDFLAPSSVSFQIELKRLHDPLYLTSRAITMGSMITEGIHLYLDYENPQWKSAFKYLLSEVAQIQEANNVNTIILRDFWTDNQVMHEFLLAEGFAKIDMPNSNILDNLQFNSSEDYLGTLSAKSRAHLRSDVLKLEDRYEVVIKDSLTSDEQELFRKLYLQIKERNYAINYFAYPPSLFRTIDKVPNWEFILLYLKPEFDTRAERQPVSIGACFKGADHYSPLLLGMDYNFALDNKVYKQSLYQVVKRAGALNKSKVYMGLSADIEKRKFGAEQVSRYAYFDAKDNYNFEHIESMSVMEDKSFAPSTWNTGEPAKA